MHVMFGQTDIPSAITSLSTLYWAGAAALGVVVWLFVKGRKIAGKGIG